MVVGSGCVIVGGEAQVCYMDAANQACIGIVASDACGLGIVAGRVLPLRFSLQSAGC